MTGAGRGDTFDQVLARARSGDEDAFAVLWRSHQPRLLRFLRGLAAPEDAADVASAVWIEVVRGLASFEGTEAGLRAWLFTIARSRVIDLRRAGSRRVATVAEDRAGEMPAPGDDPVEQLEGRLATERAIELISLLPPDQAEVLLLRIVADLDVADVAAIVGKKPGTVRVTAHRGLRRLAELLGDVAAPDGAE